ncbi:PREDICTED: BTB/POZ domain-containing protein At5g66560-like [Nelumbo nucifera]|uniref:BTB/POZ domain-containing protein At5g66560-like n=2 Tax=Nelumbo nucifera TaxID=4432 RepID=A0A1U8A0E1_NELNU|nr:PREDICTED: BTB/POZ domain-containing protein At5g66560-like [Nelumbo nucifera]XP_010255029.1 PREDICTED: BTB/POZ domain-containing protein At5g66560-like [Nelumbo nucifera]DAD40588.1 TPA_asm: hypothetical protein HUJ06_014911 [Nelumbo nucifera]
MAAEIEKPGSKGQAWFCTTGLPSDIVIEVDDMTFHLHKFPLMAKSRKLHLMITEQEANLARRREELEQEADEDDDEGDIEIEEEPCYISLPDFPGGSETFETAAKFCYGVKIDFTAWNVAPLRCAGDHLEMTEDFSEHNLISKTERFLTHSVLRNIKESLKTLKSCEALIPLAEELNIPQRCIDSIAARASSTDPSLFGWPVNEGAGTGSARSQILWNGIETGTRRRNGSKSTTASNAEPLSEDLGILSLPVFKQLVSTMKSRDLSSDIMESCLLSYAKRSIPGLSRSNRKPPSATITSDAEQRELLETVITNLPQGRSWKSRSGSSTMTRLLFGLLRTANILNASEACRGALERKIASQLEQATLDDLLIPSYSYLIETLYDVDCVERILGYFLEGLETGMDDDDEVEGGKTPGVNPVMLVGKLMDGYLSEIASDANLKPEKFWELAVALPDQARLYDDGLYRAIDVYLKAHPWITEEEREKICGVMDCQKLTLEACTHAAQNERLPLRAVVQVLFFEQLQLRHAITGSLFTADIVQPDSARPSFLLQQQRQHETGEEEGEGGQQLQHYEERQLALVPSGGQESGSSRTWRAAVRENQVLRLDMDSMRSRVHELERECSTMKKAIARMDKLGGWRNSLTKKLGCKFKTQVCDSHERTVVEARKQGRHHHHHQPTSFL